MIHTGVAASDASVLWTQVAVLLLLAWLLGAVARRLGQPPIVGSLLAGLLAGPSVFGQVWPIGFHWFRPGTELHAGLLAAVADFSLLILLIALGAETDLPLIRSLGRPAVAVVTGSLLLPLAAGAAVAFALPASFLGRQHQRTSLVLIMAAAIAVSSLPVIARIMSEMGMTRRNVGQLSVAAATLNDGVGFILLAVAVALVGSGGLTQLAVAVAGLLLLVVILASGGQRLLDAALRRTRRGAPDIGAGVGVCAVFTFLAAAAGQLVGVDAALGAFLAGIVIGRSRFVAPRVLDTIQWTSDAIFAPLYFATAGISVDVTLLGRDSTWLWFLVVLAVALVSKFVGVYAGARAAAVAPREAAALGVSLNGRGALQVILATAGIAEGILGVSAFTVIILLSIASSIAVPPTMRRLLSEWRGSADEQERLRHEAEMATNVVVRGQRLLLPTRGSANSIAAARILDLAWPQASDVTLLLVSSATPDIAGIDDVRATLATREVHEEEADEDDVVAAILAEARLGYGAIAVGAADRPTPERLLPPFIEELLNHSPIPLVVVRRAFDRTVLDERGRPVIRPRRIIVPITGNAASRAGQEVAQNISRNTGADIRLLHVVTRPSDRARPGRALRSASATAVLEEARRDATDRDLDPEVVVRDGAFSGEEIAREIADSDADLVVVGTTVRRVDGRPFLGHTIEHLLEHVTTTTVVAVILPDAQLAAADEHIDRDTG